MITQSSLTVAETFQNAQPDTILIFVAAVIFLAAVFLLIRCYQGVRSLADERGKGASALPKQPVSDGTAGQPSIAPAGASASAAAAAGPGFAPGPAQDLQLIAVITADGIVIRSIRRSANNNWKRA